MNLVRVYNPTNERYVVEWDRKNGVKLFPIEAKTEAVFLSYIAKKYIREMYDRIIITKADEAVRKENQRRIKAGMAVMDKTLKTNEQTVFESKFYIGNDTRAKEIIATLYVGVESEFGVDRASETQAEQADDQSDFDRAMKTVQEEKAAVVTPSTQTEFKCDWPDCDVTSATRAGIMSHKRSHRPKEDDAGLEKKKKEAVAQVSQ